ncbi:MAG TPA: pyridoxamine 5'-phosphate oxidase family protein [Pseudonocardiaceae bacterium]|jgi:hypothetical protein|nr:pyridoxamine 5'-phosphate oxidase family protein [Pseudonocardiaceae bacterium]
MTETTELTGLVEINSAAELRELLGEPNERVANKDRPVLHDIDRQWLAESRFCLVATSAADGTCDVSPKGDPAGFTVILDERTIAIPERPGNKRADGFHNVLSNPHVGLIYLLGGRTDTLRINGRAQLVRDAPFFDRMIVRGNRPALALIVHIEQIFYHCAKAFLRSGLWQPDTWNPASVPTRPHIARALERPEDSIEVLQEYYGPSYAERLYG